MIDRAEDWDGDAVPAARNRPADGERGDVPSADVPTGDDRPVDAGRTDAVLAAPDERAAAQRRYQDTVDHTYDVARVDAGQESGSRRSEHARESRAEDASTEGATRDADAKPDPGPVDGEAAEGDKPGAGEPDGEASEGRARDGGAREARERDVEDAEARLAAGEVPEAKDARARADTGARDAWARALPGLRAEWEKHEQEFPGQSRTTAGTQADGSWVGDGDRRLTPEQNTDASKACEDIRTEGTEVILPAMQRVESADPERRLAGLEHMFKGEDRLKEKMADYLRAPGTTVPEALDTVPDAVRFTFAYDSDRYAEGVLSDIDRIKSEGFELIKLKNLWTEEQYKGINSQWSRPETGLRLEMQFHTPESREAKELTHAAYERIRSPSASAERSKLEDFQRRVNERLPTPPGTDAIRDFPEKRR